MDSHSSDATARIAAGEGARVVQDDEVLPAAGPGYGKGEAMWKSLAVVSGEIVVWLDADVVDFDPAFVTGLLGPLLTEPEVGYVKALYRRRLGEDDDEGGRVTEICARPLINLFYPELAGFVQPLAGEAAGRLELLRAVPFFSGYAVELGLLIDLSRHAGLGALAQVDLGRADPCQPADRGPRDDGLGHRAGGAAAACGRGARLPRGRQRHLRAARPGERRLRAGRGRHPSAGTAADGGGGLGQGVTVGWATGCAQSRATAFHAPRAARRGGPAGAAPWSAPPERAPGRRAGPSGTGPTVRPDREPSR